MAYTTNARVKNGLPLNYDTIAKTKLTQDGYFPGGTFDETSFLTNFVNQGASYIDDYIGGGPFSSNGVLNDINKAHALYHIELYLISATVDRVMSITIFNQWQQAQKLLDKIVAGEITVASTDGGGNQIGLVEPDDDGITLVIGDMEEDLFFGESDATEIPE